MAGAYAGRRRRFVPVHRFMGATYVASATSLGVTGLILAPTACTSLVASARLHRLGPGHADLTVATGQQRDHAGVGGSERRGSEEQMTGLPAVDSMARRMCRRAVGSHDL